MRSAISFPDKGQVKKILARRDRNVRRNTRTKPALRDKEAFHRKAPTLISSLVPATNARRPPGMGRGAKLVKIFKQMGMGCDRSVSMRSRSPQAGTNPAFL